LDKTSAELNSDRNGVQAELDAILEYWAKIQEQCVEKAEPYEEKKKRREEEKKALQDAITILDTMGPAAAPEPSEEFLQIRKH